MNQANVINLSELRRSCASCSLQQLCLPATATADELRRLDEVVRSRRPLKRGERLYRQGEKASSLFVSRDGAFKTVALDANGESQVIGLHLPGELIGLDGMGSGHHLCDAEALQSASVCQLPMERLEDLLQQIPGLQRQLLRVMGRSRDHDQSHLELLARRQADDRMLLFLYSLRERYRQLGSDADRITLPMSREDMASYLGVVLETVSRSLGRLQDDGLIQVRGRQLQFTDANELARRVHGGQPPR
ncbi:MAG: helix-turn-helix domain-containing protein [Lysobacteraceae bacterium]